MLRSLKDSAVLSNQVQMPWLGLGVWRVPNDEAEQAVASAIKAGYRSIDTAALYQNEEGVGRAIKASGIPREELFITTKVWNTDQGYESTLKAYAESLAKLQLEYADLYLIHWPVKGKYKETWRALEQLYKEGKVRAIGVSNFQPLHIDDLLTEAEVVPMVNQVELHPMLTQEPLRAYCEQKGILVEAWSPLMRGALDNPVLAEIAARHRKTPAQVVLRWDLQHGIITIPKTVRAERMVENADVFDFVLSDEEMKAIDGLNQNHRLGPDPDSFDL